MTEELIQIIQENKVSKDPMTTLRVEDTRDKMSGTHKTVPPPREAKRARTRRELSTKFVHRPWWQRTLMILGGISLYFVALLISFPQGFLPWIRLAERLSELPFFLRLVLALGNALVGAELIVLGIQM